MARALVPGSLLNKIFGSGERWPAYQVLVWDPHVVTIAQVATRTVLVAPVDLTEFVSSMTYKKNVGYENGNDPTTPSMSFDFRRSRGDGTQLRRGLFEDGVIVQVRQGDVRVSIEDWIPVFTGTFRGRPGDDPGTPDEQSEGLAAVAYGREERYLNLVITTESFPVDTDVGTIAYEIARTHMGLSREEILFGAQGFAVRHLTTQLVEIPALEALWQLFFVVGKKPMFDEEGRLTAVDVNLDKSPTRIYSEGGDLIRSIRAEPNDVEVNNSIVIRGLDHNLGKVPGEPKLLVTREAVTGFFDSSYDESLYYSEDRTQRAEDTYLVTKKKITWSGADWSESDEFHGKLEIDTRYLRNARFLIFKAWLDTQLAVATIDLLIQSGVNGNTVVLYVGTPVTLAILREILHVLSVVALAGLLWSMNYLGRGVYEVWGTPYEYAFRELVARHQLIGLAPEEVREIEFRNDLISTMEKLNEVAAERLRRELVKDQLFTIQVLDDPVLEVDDVIETADGSRYYVVSVEKTIDPQTPTILQMTCWKIEDGVTREIDALSEGL